MNATSRKALLALVGLLAVGTVARAVLAGEAPPPGKITLVPVKWDGYLARVVNKKAKLTIVDAWATWCGPCKANFPHLVELHKKYAAQGLNVISLSLDEADRPKKVAEATAFLESKEAVFTNLILVEKADDAFEKLNIGAIPAVFLYGPDGKELRRFTLDDVDNQFTYVQVEQAVQDFLAGKPIAEGQPKKK